MVKEIAENFFSPSKILEAATETQKIRGTRTVFFTEMDRLGEAVPKKQNAGARYGAPAA
jgi:hypothetical protein